MSWLSRVNLYIYFRSKHLSGSDSFILKYHARGDVTRFKHSNSEVNNWNWYKWHLEIYSVVLCRLSQILLGLPGTFYSTYILLESGNCVFNPPDLFSNAIASRFLSSRLSHLYFLGISRQLSVLSVNRLIFHVPGPLSMMAVIPDQCSFRSSCGVTQILQTGTAFYLIWGSVWRL